LPLDVLKIDRSFVSEVDRRTSNQSLIRAMLDLADEMDLETVAEGPERREEIEFLNQSRCDYAQGYYYSKPLPPEQFVEYLATS
jgi:EAL domain-containing protein (putative c-di-GMP-specific phosphodiesterase class I)